MCWCLIKQRIRLHGLYLIKRWETLPISLSQFSIAYEIFRYKQKYHPYVGDKAQFLILSHYCIEDISVKISTQTYELTLHFPKRLSLNIQKFNLCNLRVKSLATILIFHYGLLETCPNHFVKHKKSAEMKYVTCSANPTILADTCPVNNGKYRSDIMTFLFIPFSPFQFCSFSCL